MTKNDLLILSSAANPLRLVMIQTQELRTLVLARRPNTQICWLQSEPSHTTVELHRCEAWTRIRPFQTKNRRLG